MSEREDKHGRIRPRTAFFVFFASLIYLPLLFILMAFDPTGGTFQ